MVFKKGVGDWTQYRAPDVMEVDFHRADPYRKAYRGAFAFEEAMALVKTDTLEALKTAQHAGFRGVLLTHGWSTSRRGRMSSRSVIRGVMRSKDATPYIIRSECIEHDSVFFAAIRPALPSDKRKHVKGFNVDDADGAE
jgi:hypothetical protein